MKEKALLNTIQMVASKLGHRLFRNNTGVGWQGIPYWPSSRQQVWVDKGDLVLKNARALHAGIGTGGCDLIGWTTVVVTADMVGKPMAVMTAVEGKLGRLQATAEQQNFINTLNAAGGIALIARDSEDYRRRVAGNMDEQQA